MRWATFKIGSLVARLGQIGDLKIQLCCQIKTQFENMISFSILKRERTNGKVHKFTKGIMYKQEQVMLNNIFSFYTLYLFQ